MEPDDRGVDFLASAMVIGQLIGRSARSGAGRLAFLFDYAPAQTLRHAAVRAELSADGARSVVTALAEELASAPRLDREKFRAAANQVKARTGQKGKALFHPIRVG